jgi:hypothetical protein
VIDVGDDRKIPDQGWIGGHAALLLYRFERAGSAASRW